MFKMKEVEVNEDEFKLQCQRHRVVVYRRYTYHLIHENAVTVEFCSLPL